ncbi:MAG: adenylate/guanylate cyclase domain-containing protein, partial [Marinomonas sp.]
MTAPTSGTIASYCGHMFSAGSAAETALAGEIAAAISDNAIRIAYGPLACGADILIAEAILEAGAELNVVLPFAADDFIRESVLCGGEEWLPRYHACMERAASVHFATSGAYVGDDNQFAYNTRLAMGLAVLRSQELPLEPVQLAVVSDKFKSYSLTGLAGTVADIALWQDLGRTTISIPAGDVPRDLSFPPKPQIIGDNQRDIRSIIFADYKGFSRLGERELPLFMAEVMGRISSVLNAYGEHVEFRNTWGDAIYVITDEPRHAASIALDLQSALADLSPALMPSGEIAGMRIGVHFGPIWVGTDQITGGKLCYGGEVNKTARIEP